jgi:hypothetical protein
MTVLLLLLSSYYNTICIPPHSQVESEAVSDLNTVYVAGPRKITGKTDRYHTYQSRNLTQRRIRSMMKQFEIITNKINSKLIDCFVILV